MQASIVGANLRNNAIVDFPYKDKSRRQLNRIGAQNVHIWYFRVQITRINRAQNIFSN